VATVLKSNRQIVEKSTKSISVTHKYMIVHSPELIQRLHYKVAGLN